MNDGFGFGAGPGINGSPTGPSFRGGPEPSGRPGRVWTLVVLVAGIAAVAILIVW